MAAITHVFVSAKPDAADASLVRPSNWNDFHKIVYVGQNIVGADTILLAADVVRLAAGTYAVTVPAATGSKKSITVCQDGAGVMTLTPTGGDTIGGLVSFALTAVGQSCILVDEAAGTWGLLAGSATTTLAGAYANGSSAANQTLALLDTKGGGLVVDGTSASFTGAYALLVKGETANTVGNRVALNVVGGTVAPTSGTTILIGNLNQADTIFQPPSGTAAFVGLNLAYEFDPTSTSGTISGLTINARSLGLTGYVSNVYLINAFCNTISGTATFLVQANGSTAILTSPTDAIVPPSALKVQTSSNTKITAGTESISIDFNMTNARQWSAGALTTQRDCVFRSSSYAFTAGSTVTTGATVAITGAPSAGSNATITMPLALWVQAGTSLFSSQVAIGSWLVNPASPCILGLSFPSIDDIPPGSGPGPFTLVGASNNALSMGIATDGAAWMQAGSLISATGFGRLRINENGGSVSINSLSASPQSTLILGLSPPATVTAGVVTWNGFFIPASSFDYSGTTTSTASLSAILWNGGTISYSGGTSWNIIDAATLFVPSLAFNVATCTRTWAARLGGNVQFSGGVQLLTRQVTTTPYTILGQPGINTTPRTADCVLQVTNAAATSLNLPSIAIVGGGWILPIGDSRYTAGSNNITLVPNGADKINNVAGNYVLKYNGQSVCLVANATTNNWELLAYQPNVTIGGVGEMYEYANAISLVIDQVNTYHPIWTAGVTDGTLDGFTFVVGFDSTYSAVTNLGGGQISFTVPAGHTMVAGQIFCVTSASVAGYRPPNPTIFVVQSVTATTIVVNGTFTATATGTWNRGASLVAGSAAAGKYVLQWSATITPAGTNKNWKMEPLQNTTNVDKGAQGPFQLGGGGSGAAISGQALVVVAAGDIFTLVINNTTDSTDVTITDLNYSLVRYQ